MSSRKQSSGGGGAGGHATTGSSVGVNTKKGTTKDSSKGMTAEQPDEEPLVAVILADSYNDHFAPLTLSWPRCLLPLANVPLLHYSIESATRAGVQHIYVVTRAHAQRIRQHVQESLQELLHGQGISITVISTPEALSEGDALRELDAKQVIRSDFLLFRADSVCTMDLRPVVERHRQRRALDKDVIMTVCCMPALAHMTMRSKAIGPVQYVDSRTNELLHYETMYGYPRRKASMPFELLRLDDKTGREEVDVRQDLVEAGVYVCSIDVPPLFSENFDYQSLQVDFIPGILTSDLLESKIFLHIGKRGYGGRAQDTQTYDAISRDILRRWTSPFTPSSAGWLGERMTERRGWRFIGQDVHMDRSSVVGPCSMIASQSFLAADVTIVGSILCEGVHVGRNSSVVDSHLHASVSLGRNVRMTRCIVGQNAKLLDNVVLGRGCLIGADCIVGPDVTLPEGSRVGIRKKETWEGEEEDEDDKEQRYDEHAIVSGDDSLGTRSRGVLWPNLWRRLMNVLKEQNTKTRSSDDESDDDDDEIEEEEEEEEVANLCLRSIGFQEAVDVDHALLLCTKDETESVSSIEVDSEFGDIDEDGHLSDTARSVLSSSHVHGGGGGGGGGGEVTNLTLAAEGDTQLEKEANDARVLEFEAEARASLTRALEENHSIDNASLELKTLRMASNVEPRDVQRVVLEVLLERCKPNDAKQVQTLITRWAKLIGQTSQEDEVYTLTVLQLFYNEDVLSDESVIAWWRSKKSQSGGEKAVELRNRAQVVVRYILENDEDEDDSE